MCFCVPTLLLHSLKILLHPCDFIYLICYVASASTEDVVLSRVGHAHKLNLEFSVNKLNEHSLFIGITGIRLRI